MNFIARQCMRVIKNEITNQSHVCGLGRTLSYKSAYCLENLYPKSNLKLYTPNFVPEDPTAKFSGYIPISELSITYSCSSGPGGQNVNRVNTKVDIRFNVKDATWLSQDIKDKLLEQCKTKINKEGCLIIKSDITRSQQLNLADALEKLRRLIRSSFKPVPQVSEETEEKIRKRKIKAARQRVFVKRMRSMTKQHRQGLDTNL